MSQIKQQLNLFYIAVGFLTRLPVPKVLDFSQENLNHASRYFSLVGWLVGLLNILAFYLAIQIFPLAIAILFMMLSSLLLTGCFHEDGLADTCDGFGGGWTQQQKLAIMKDSRLGTYGAAGLWFVLSLKFFLLWHIGLNDESYLYIAILVAQPFSRAISTVLIFLLPYVTENDASKVKPLAEKQRVSDLSINLLVASIALLFVIENVMLLCLVVMITTICIRYFLIKQIQGFTGDTLGAAQQITELTIYLTLLALFQS